MKKIAVTLGVIAVSSVALIAPAPAAASCSEIIEGTGCFERVVCGTADLVFNKTPLGRTFECIQ